MQLNTLVQVDFYLLRLRLGFCGDEGYAIVHTSFMLFRYCGCMAWVRELKMVIVPMVGLALDAN